MVLHVEAQSRTQSKQRVKSKKTISTPKSKTKKSFSKSKVRKSNPKIRKTAMRRKRTRTIPTVPKPEEVQIFTEPIRKKIYIFPKVKDILSLEFVCSNRNFLQIYTYNILHSFAVSTWEYTSTTGQATLLVTDENSNPQDNGTKVVAEDSVNGWTEPVTQPADNEQINTTTPVEDKAFLDELVRISQPDRLRLSTHAITIDKPNLSKVEVLAVVQLLHSHFFNEFEVRYDADDYCLHRP